MKGNEGIECEADEGNRHEREGWKTRERHPRARSVQ